MQTRRKLLLKFTSIAAAAAICSCALYPYGGTLGAPPLNAFSVDSETDVVFDEETGMLYLYGDFKKSDVQAYSGNDAVKGVIAGEYAVLPADSSGLFQGFRSAKQIVLDYADFSIVSDMSSMFSECESLEKLDLGTFETAAVTDMSGMFSGCKALKELNIKSFDTAKVTDMSEMFLACSSLESLDLSNFDTSAVTDMSKMFSECNALKELNIKSFDTAKVTNMSGMFLACSSLESLDLSNFDTSAVTDMSKMFSNCNALKELNIKSFDTAQVTDMSTMFYGCSGLKSMDLSSFDTARVTNMSTMFYGCSGLNGIDLSSFDTAAVTDMSGMFACCDSLTDLDLTGFDTSRVQKMGMMFYLDSSLSSITVSRKWDISSLVPEDGLGGDYAFDGCTSLVGGAGTVYDSSMIDSGYAHIDGGSKNPGYLTAAAGEPCVRFDEATGTLYLSGNVVLDEVRAYANNDTVLHVVAEEGTVFPESCYEMFKNFKSTETMDLSKADTSQVEVMFGLFSGCNNLTALDLSNFDTSKVTNMGSMFLSCQKLTALDLSNFDTSKVTDMGSMFGLCYALAELNLSSFDTSNVTRMTNMFNDCSTLKKLDVSGFDTSNVQYMNSMFRQCSKLKRITVSDAWSTASVTESEEMFVGCTSLVGEKGTVFDAEHTDAAYAHIDGGSENPGYLTSAEAASSCVRFDEATGTLYLSGDVVLDEVRAYAKNEAVKHVVAEEGTVFPKDSSNLFFEFYYVQTMDLSKADTSQVTNMRYMFNECSSIRELDISSFDTSHVTVMVAMFAYCNALEKLDLSGFDTRNVTDMRSMFGDCYALEQLDISSFDTANVNYMNGMFSQCDALKTITVGDKWSTASVTGSDAMFELCEALVGGSGTVYDKNHIDAAYAQIDGGAKNPGYLTAAPAKPCVRFDAATGTLYLSGRVDSDEVQTYAKNEAVKHVVAEEGTVFQEYSGDVFLNFYYVQTIDLSKADTTEVYTMDSMFRNCRALTELDLSSFNTSGVLTMFDMFKDCGNLSRIIVSDLWDNSLALGNSKSMFEGCTVLVGGSGTVYDAEHTDAAYAHIDGGAENPGYLTAAEAAPSSVRFDEVTGTLYLSGNVVASEVKVYAYNEAVLHVVAEEGTVFPENCGNLFAGFSFAETMDLANADTGNVWDVISMFSGCKKLTELDLSSFDTSGAGPMVEMFCECSALKTLDLSSFNTSNVTSMSAMFYGCSSLTALDLSSFDTSNVIGMEYMFDSCGSLKTITVGDAWSTASVTNSSNMFSRCEALVGGSGTVYDAEHIDAAYAHIDGGAENPGYLTAKTDKYSISFDANGGTGSMESVEITAGEIFTLPECGFTAPTYQKFTGWIVGGAQKQPGDTVTLNADTVLTASWDYALITVTFDANGGEGSFVDMTLLSGAMFVFPVCEFLAPEGKTFAGWQYGELTAQPGTHTTFDTDMTVKAIWKDLSDTILVGDVNGDGTVDSGDEMLLSRYVGAWDGIELELAAADLDRDGKVDIRDAMILSRYIAAWDGYAQYIIEIQK
ncbi:MAG: BspA family leucine-rich repeat surface protein [Oscillospiraceae bacterium]|nr:BspA family leucine-rich repeat surface protein [Oscillospiraceae bacterium]